MESDTSSASSSSSAVSSDEQIDSVGKRDLGSSLDRLNEASKQAFRVVRKHAAVSPPRTDDGRDGTQNNSNNNNNNNPWKNPQAIEDELADARKTLAESWEDLRVAHDEKCSASGSEGRGFEEDYYCGNDDDDDNNDNRHTAEDMSEDEFRSVYTEMMTETFGDVLDRINQEDGSSFGKKGQPVPVVDVDILVECLQSGIGLLEEADQKNRRSFFDSIGYNNGSDSAATDDGDDGSLPIHELRQRSLGYLVVPSE